MASQFVSLEKCKGYSFEKPYLIVLFYPGRKRIDSYRLREMNPRLFYKMWIDLRKTKFWEEHTKYKSKENFMDNIYEEVKRFFYRKYDIDWGEYLIEDVNCYCISYYDLFHICRMKNIKTREITSCCRIASYDDLDHVTKSMRKSIERKLINGTLEPVEDELQDKAYEINKYTETHTFSDDIVRLCTIDKSKSAHIGKLYEIVEAECYLYNIRFLREKSGRFLQRFAYYAGLECQKLYDTMLLNENLDERKRLFKEIMYAAFKYNSYKLLFANMFCYRYGGNWDENCFELFTHALQCKDIEEKIELYYRQREIDEQESEKFRDTAWTTDQLREAYGIAMESDSTASWNIDDQE